MPSSITTDSTHKIAYGCRFDKDMEDWVIELRLYFKNADYRAAQKAAGKKVEVLEKWEHFKNCAEILFGPGSEVEFVWHPWAIDMLQACCENQFVGMAGSSSCGKSEFMGLWLVLNFFADYYHTLCIATSKSLRESKRRIWASVRKYYDHMPPGLDGVICKYTEHPTSCIQSIRNGKRQDNSGIILVPADASQSNTKTNKLQGIKAYKNKKAKSRMFLAGDEYTELSHALSDTLKSNLSNNDEFHAIFAANPASKYDPFGLMVRPKYGWGSIHVEMLQWEMAIGGVCLHFDALKNPNYLAKENIWPCIQHLEKVEAQIAEAGGSNTPKFWRNCRAFWPPAGMEDSGVFSESEITMKGNDTVFDNWGPRARERWGGVDVAFAEGGDRCILMVGDRGVEKDTGKDIVSLVKYFELHADTDNTDEDVEHQIARKIIEHCDEEGIEIDHLGVDATGNGSSFCSILAEMWESNAFRRVQFGGAATERPASDLEDVPSNEKYANRSAELWFYGKEMIRHGQLWGLQWSALVSELTTRKHTTSKSAKGYTVVKIEGKRELRKRCGVSPDIADAMCVMLDTIREAGSFIGNKTYLEEDVRSLENWNEFVKERDVVAKSNQRMVRVGPEAPTTTAAQPWWAKKQPRMARMVR